MRNRRDGLLHVGAALLALLMAATAQAQHDPDSPAPVEAPLEQFPVGDAPDAPDAPDALNRQRAEHVGREKDGALRLANMAVSAASGLGLLSAGVAFIGVQGVTLAVDPNVFATRLASVAVFGLVGVAGLAALAAAGIDFGLFALADDPGPDAFTWERSGGVVPAERPPGDLAERADGGRYKRWLLGATGVLVGAFFVGTGSVMLVFGFDADDRTGRINLPLLLSMGGAALVGVGVTSGLSGVLAPLFLHSDAELFLEAESALPGAMAPVLIE